MQGNFKLITMVVFIGFGIFGLLVFSGAIKIGSDSSQTVATGTVTLWGTVSHDTMEPIIETFNNTNKTFTVKYVQKLPATFNEDLLEAIASGTGPDMYLLPDDLALRYANKIFTVPYSSYSLTNFKNNYASAGEVFLTSKGILAFPIGIDPLMLYYNRNTLDANNIVNPPSYWDDFVTQASLLTQKDSSKKINKTAVALGQYSNISNAKEILSMLFMQAGNSIVAEREGKFVSVLVDNQSDQAELGPVLSFYTSFADPLQPNYSWNKSFPNSQSYFSSEDLAFYFGFASELPTLINKNPNHNFSVASVPQTKDAKFKSTFGHVTGIAISSFSKNLNTSIIAAGLLANGDITPYLVNALDQVPARRDLLSRTPEGDFAPVFYASALYARSWLDPSPSDTENIFRAMIENTLSNNLTPKGAIDDANSRLNLLLIK